MELRTTMKGRILPVPPGLSTTAQGHSTAPEDAIHIDDDVIGASGSCMMHQPWISQCFSRLPPVWYKESQEEKGIKLVNIMYDQEITSHSLSFKMGPHFQMASHSQELKQLQL